MTDLTLIIGDKTLSSWSMRPWLLLREADIAFNEATIELDQPESRRRLGEETPAGLVPALRAGDLVIWDSLAIMEYVAERFPEKGLWPDDRGARAVARSVSAEMHAGFSSLRTVWPMNFARESLGHLNSGGVARDIARIEAIWTSCRREYGVGGPFLFGRFSVADAMYAPVVSRFHTYGPVALTDEASAYAEAIKALPSYQDWARGAAEERGRAGAA